MRDWTFYITRILVKYITQLPPFHEITATNPIFNINLSQKYFKLKSSLNFINFIFFKILETIASTYLHSNPLLS